MKGSFLRQCPFLFSSQYFQCLEQCHTPTVLIIIIISFYYYYYFFYSGKVRWESHTLADVKELRFLGCRSCMFLITEPLHISTFENNFLTVASFCQPCILNSNHGHRLSCLGGNRADAAERKDEEPADSCVKKWSKFSVRT